MKFATVAALAALGFGVSEYASIVTGTTQILAVTSPPVDGAKCTLTSSEGTYYVTTPGNATVHKTKHDMDVVCTRDGYKDGHTVAVSHFNGATAGNIIAGGVIGIGVDAMTGANYNFPENIAVTMVPVDAPLPALPAPATPPTPADAPAKPGA